MRKLLCFFVLAFALFTSCHKSERDNDTDMTAVNDLGTWMMLDNDVFTQLHLYCDSLSSVNKIGNITAACGTVTVSGSTYPKTVTIDYGSVNCTSNGHAHRGKITAIFSGKYRDSLSSITISSTNFYIDDNAMNISETIVNNGSNASGNTVFNISVNSSATLPNARTISWSGAWKREWSAGENTPGIFTDDVFSISGSASGTGSRGNGFNMTISTALAVTGGCAWISSGKIEITPANLSVRYIDYGSACDNKAELNLNGNIQEITLP
jgi:hypothetical protein